VREAYLYLLERDERLADEFQRQVSEALSTECATRGAAGVQEYREPKAIWVGSASPRQRNPGIDEGPSSPSDAPGPTLTARP
jgi:hypothetical protein